MPVAIFVKKSPRIAILQIFGCVRTGTTQIQLDPLPDGIDVVVKQTTNQNNAVVLEGINVILCDEVMHRYRYPVCLAAAYVPGNHIKAAIGHPMVLGVKVWAFAHLLANGRLGDMILFGAFLAWGVLGYINSRKRDRAAGVVYSTKPGIARDAAVIVASIGAWLVFALWAHRLLIGVSPFGT